MWQPQQNAFGDDVRVFAPDLPGFGGQARLDGETFSMKLAARFVQRELDANKIDRFILAGLSMGGYIAFECWRLFGDRIDGMILADTRATPDSQEARAGRYAAAERIGRGDFAEWAEELLGNLLSPATLRDKPDLVDVVRRIIHSSPPESAVAALLGMAQRNDSTSLLSEINVPVSVIVGEDDRIISVAESRAMASEMPNATFTSIAGAGHLSNLENHDAFNTAVKKLLELVSQQAVA
jgi:pimeloyl-ACP methyl ester carboxylesterase